ncbi:PspC domain-containing protein [Flavobacteriaceae bacterium AU392]|nr:PspC domain-containing protein [Flavobacteriaceae bacterium]RKM83644.1 PspC domain-containing protein [Flavobacteriaceae bacterium AU392]
MNKTVNINLAGIFFHIDEDAYSKLQRYLEAIKRSFTDSQGRSEILSDIEARIAELFNERVKDEKQVISIKEVEDVITIMGQPEDYIVDEEIFEDEPQTQFSKKKSQSTRKLYRDKDNAYIAGVASGLSHYFGIEPLWIRLIWVLLVFGGGAGIFVYILLWVLMPSAESTSEKLAMTGKPINITNIEQKVKEGFSNVKESIDEVTDKVKNGDYNKTKNNSRSFFDALGDVIMFFFKIFAKFVGVILIIVGASTLIALFISLFSVGTSSFFNPWWMDYVQAGNISGGPVWLIALLTFFAVGIPFFFIFLLGLKILVNNLKSIGKIAKFTLLGLWLTSFLVLSVMSVREFTEHVIDAGTTEKTQLNISKDSALNIKMVGNDYLYESRSGRLYRNNNTIIVTTEDDQKKIYSSNVRLIIRSTEDSIASIHVQKNSDGRSYQDAREKAGNIEYNYSLNNNILSLDSYLLTDTSNKFRNQNIRIIIYLPEGTTFKLDRNTRSFLNSYRSSRNIISYSETGETHKVIDGDTECLDCKTLSIDIKNESSELKLNKEDGLKIKEGNLNIEANKKETVIEGKNIKTTIDSSGVNIKSKNN